MYHNVLHNGGIEDLRLLVHLNHTVKVSHDRKGTPPNTFMSVVTGRKYIETGMLI